MFSVVPNIHDALGGLDTPIDTTTDFRTSTYSTEGHSRSTNGHAHVTAKCGRGTKPGQPRPTRIFPSPRFHSRVLASHHRSDTKGFSQNPKGLSRVDETTTLTGRADQGMEWNAGDDDNDNCDDVFDEQLNLMSSVHVVPKTSGGGYDVYSSPSFRRRDGATSAKPFYDTDTMTVAGSLDFSPTSSSAEAEAQWATLPTKLRPEKSHGLIIATKGTQFSKNIGNPTMQKRAKDKLSVATNRAEMFRSTSALNELGSNSSLAQRTSKNRDAFSTNPDSKVLNNAHNPTPGVRDVSMAAAARSGLSTSSASLLDNGGYRSAAGIGERGCMHESLSDSNIRGNLTRMYDTLGSPQKFDLLGGEVPKPSNPSQKSLPRSGGSATKTGDTSPPKSGFFSFMKKRSPPKTLSPKQEYVVDIEGKEYMPFPHWAEMEGQTARRFLERNGGRGQGVNTAINSNHHHHNNNSRSATPFTPTSNSPGSERKTTASTPTPTTNIKKNSSSTSSNLECSCKLYHSHQFSGDVFNTDVESRISRCQEMIHRSHSQETEQRSGNVEDPMNILWVPSLSFHSYHHGNRTVDFSSLWPKDSELREHLQNSGIQQTVLSSDAFVDLCMLACTCAPLRLLKCLIELQLVRVDQVLDCGSGLLHIAVLAQNLEAVQYLMAAKVSPHLKDKQGLTADQVCYSPVIKKHMAPRYVLHRNATKERILQKPSLQDKDTIFKLAANPKHFVDIQSRLQNLDFNVNTECDNNGDFLLHIAVRKGLNQLPLLMALVKIQGADIELCNAAGMTPLMLTAAMGNCVLCDVLICLFGADPNKPNSQSGRSALHYAAEGNHRKTVECLIRRGADVNLEDHDGLRADDIPACVAAIDDCREIILFNRTRRLEMMSDLVRKGEVAPSQVLPSDLCVVDNDGHTLLMIAAIFNKFLTLHCLLEVSTSTINAQHSKTGMTALAIASRLGNTEAVNVLLKHKACPGVVDMSGYLPLHHAVLNNHEATVDSFLEFFPDTYVGLYKAMRMCKKTSIHTKLRAAWERRQEEIVTPKLLGCALSGDAEGLYILLDEGDNINPKSGTGNWPLYLAVENGHLEVLRLLIERSGDFRKRHPTTGATALHAAAKMGHHSIVAFLLQYCKQAKKKPVPQQGRQVMAAGGRGQGHAPSRSNEGHESHKRVLDINAVDKDNRTALQVAAEKGFSRIVELLLQHGATTAMLDTQGNLVTCPQFEGVRIMIESHREQHTRQVIKCIEDKSRKGLSILQQIWLPKFDHHLRTKDGSTPLMVAACMGKIPVIQFLLESAIYPESGQYDSDGESESDADSGVLDHTLLNKDQTDFIASHDGLRTPLSLSTEVTLTPKQDLIETVGGPENDLTKSWEIFNQTRLNRIVHDANRPKGLSIYYEGVVSHVCAVNLCDGTNVLHQAVRGADSPQVLSLLLMCDSTPLNMQDDRGETVLHLACRMGRKKCVEMLLAQPGLDLNIRTLEGLLPEEVATSKAICRMVEKARASGPAPPTTQAPMFQTPAEASMNGSERSPSITGSTVNFDKVHNRYEELKHGGKSPWAS